MMFRVITCGLFSVIAGMAFGCGASVDGNERTSNSGNEHTSEATEADKTSPAACTQLMENAVACGSGNPSPHLQCKCAKKGGGPLCYGGCESADALCNRACECFFGVTGTGVCVE